LFCCFCL